VIQPTLTPVPGKNEYMLVDDYPCDGHLIPAYFCLDGASVPWYAWVAIYTPFHPDVMAAAVDHDWIYLTHQIPRKEADQRFYSILIKNGVSKTKAKLMYQAVRVGGGLHWERSKKDIEKLELLYPMIYKSANFDKYCFPEVNNAK
jgi:hypothetical protein